MIKAKPKAEGLHLTDGPLALRVCRRREPKAMRPFSQTLTGKTIEKYVKIREGLQTVESMAKDLSLDPEQIEKIIARIKNR